MHLDKKKMMNKKIDLISVGLKRFNRIQPRISQWRLSGKPTEDPKLTVKDVALSNIIFDAWNVLFRSRFSFL